MRKIIIVIFLTTLIFKLCADNIVGLEYFDRTQSMIFNEDNVVYEYWDYKTDEIIKEVLECSYQDQGKISFIIFPNYKDQKWLYLRDEGYIFIYNIENEAPFFVGTTYSVQSVEMLPTYHHDEVKTTSHLIEGNKIYDSNNLGNIKTNHPWSDGVTGYGIGEKIIIEELNGLNYFMISNGYVSFNKPYLYEQNSRLKKVLFRNIKTGSEYYFELEDTPHFQEIFFPDDAVSIEIEIIEVYPGSKYDDTCVNFLLYM